MSRHIPQVRCWKITLTDGRIYYNHAPTRLLARLAFRDEIGWQATHPIKTIGRCRMPQGGTDANPTY